MVAVVAIAMVHSADAVTIRCEEDFLRMYKVLGAPKLILNQHNNHFKNLKDLDFLFNSNILNEPGFG